MLGTILKDVKLFNLWLAELLARKTFYWIEDVTDIFGDLC